MATKQPKGGSEDLGTLLRTRREALGLSRREVADRSGLSYPYVSQLETGYRLPSPRAMHALARALHVPAAELLHALGDVSTPKASEPSWAPAPRTDPRGSGWIANPTHAAPPPASALAPPPASAPSAPPSAAPPSRAAVRAAIDLLSTVPPPERLEALNEVQAAVVASLIERER